MKAFRYSLTAVLLLLVGWVEVQAQEQTVGLFVNDDRAFEGYTLFSAGFPMVYLIDNNGQKVHSWELEYSSGGSVYLEPNGHLLLLDRTPASHPNPQLGAPVGGIRELDWEGNLVWEYVYSDSLNRTHHDLARMPNGNVVVTAYQYKNKAEAIAAGRDPNTIPTRPDTSSIWTDHLIEIRPILPDSGEIVWEWHAWDHLIQDVDPSQDNFGVVEDHPELLDINYYGPRSLSDWLHINTVNYNEELDQIVLSSPHLNEIYVIDHSTTTEEAAGHTGGRYGQGGDILYRWGNPAAFRAGTADDQMLFFNHDPNWIPAGYPGADNMLIFDNGRYRPVPVEENFSSIFEIALPAEPDGTYRRNADGSFADAEVIWQYSDPGTFFSEIVSGMQRQPNGNTLITEGTDGRIFEVSTDGDIVWDYINPVIGNGPLTQGEPVPPNMNNPDWFRNLLFRSYRYPLDYPAFLGKDLSPKGTVEATPTAIASNFDVPEGFSLAQNYPNPFNPTTTLAFTLPQAGTVTLSVYNTLGQRVATVAERGFSQGTHTVRFEAGGLPSGVYLYRLEGDGFTATRRMMLVK